MIIFHHNDFDGRCAAWIVWKKFHKQYYKNGKKVKGKRMKFIEVNYGHRIDFKDIQLNETIYIVDFSFDVEQMKELLKITNNIHWIDHHITAINKFADFPYTIKGIRKNGIAGCVLTWEYLFPDKKIPYYVRLVGDYDVWTFKYGMDTRYFQLGLKVENTELHSLNLPAILSSNVKYNFATFLPCWDKLHKPWNVRKIINKGKAIYDYNEKQNEQLCNSGFNTELNGYTAFAVNSTYVSSDTFASMEKGYKADFKYDIWIGFYKTKEGKWKYSLRRPDWSTVDLSEIAKSYGGGGHVAAAGFTIDELIV